MQLSSFASIAIEGIRDAVIVTNVDSQERGDGVVAGMPETITMEVMVNSRGMIDLKPENNQHKVIVTFPVCQNPPHEKKQ